MRRMPGRQNLIVRGSATAKFPDRRSVCARTAAGISDSFSSIQIRRDEN
jgi:hypothetical protein